MPKERPPHPVSEIPWGHNLVLRIVQSLPESLKGSLPTIEEIEAELGQRGPR